MGTASPHWREPPVALRNWSPFKGRWRGPRADVPYGVEHPMAFGPAISRVASSCLMAQQSLQVFLVLGPPCGISHSLPRGPAWPS